MDTIDQSAMPGETSKEDRISFAIESLMNGENNQKIIDNLKLYHDTGRGSRVSIFHENIETSEKTMAMTEAVYNKMKSLAEETSKTKKEHAFLVLGWVQSGHYLFRGIASDTDIDDETKKAVYDRKPEWKTEDSAVDFNILLTVYWRAINSHIDKMEASGLKPLISLGHTHPDGSESYGNYSLPDLAGFSIQREAICGDRNDDEVEYCHIILPVNGDVDCMTFDTEAKRFKKITNVLSIGQNGEEAVPAYTFESPKTLSDASYVKEKGESEDDKMYDACIEDILREHEWDTIAE